MKTNCINTLARFCGLTMGLAMFAGTAVRLSAAEIPTAKGGGTRLLELEGRLVTPKTELVTLKPMSCAKCKDEYVTRTDWSARGSSKPTITVARHLCDGCGNEWVVSGHGKAKTSAAVHKCNSCGAESLACCAATAKDVATNGMDKKFEVAPVK